MQSAPAYNCTKIRCPTRPEFHPSPASSSRGRASSPEFCSRTYIQATENLASRLHSITTLEGIEKVRQLAPAWRARIPSIVAALHGRGYCLNEEISQCDLDESELVVDRDDCIWLPLSHIFLLDNKGSDEFRRRASKDDEAIRRVFEEFVPGELKKREAELESK